MGQLKLVSVNIERSKHLDRLETFIAKVQPDVLCLQELCEHDIPRIEAMFGGVCIFAPVAMIPADAPGTDLIQVGNGICTKLPVTEHKLEYYIGNEADARYPEHRPEVLDKPLLICKVEHEGDIYQVATTHFDWTPDGSASDEQRRDIKTLITILETIGEFVLTGDFNAPRIYKGKPGEIFSQLAEKYKDNIPAKYETSLDLDLHRAGKNIPCEIAQIMVDGLFTTSGYIAKEVELHTGVSDHCAITALITR